MADICHANLELGHETVPCLLNDGHDGPHRDPGFGAWPPCPNCGGLDAHSEACPTPGLPGRAATWADVTWEDGGKPRVRCGAWHSATRFRTVRSVR